MDALWEFIKDLGALVGLATGAFVLREHYIRERPLAFIVPQPLIPGSSIIVPRLRIVNRSARPIIVSWPTGGHPFQFRIANNTSVDAIVWSVREGGEGHQAVHGEETIDLELFVPTRLADIDADNVIDTELWWTFAQPIFWQRPRSLPIHIKKATLLRLLGKNDGDEDVI